MYLVVWNDVHSSFVSLKWFWAYLCGNAFTTEPWPVEHININVTVLVVIRYTRTQTKPLSRTHSLKDILTRFCLLKYKFPAYLPVLASLSPPSFLSMCLMAHQKWVWDGILKYFPLSLSFMMSKHVLLAFLVLCLPANRNWVLCLSLNHIRGKKYTDIQTYTLERFRNGFCHYDYWVVQLMFPKSTLTKVYFGKRTDWIVTCIFEI